MGDQITWGDFYSVAVNIDAMAATMNVSGYSKLLENNDTPFPLDAVVPLSFSYRFDVVEGDGFPEITSHWMKASGGGGVPMPEPLASLAAAGHLYFRNDPDDCWCSTLFRVVPIGSLYKLVEIDDTTDAGCCQTLSVPDVGDLLDRTQKFIPSGYSAFYNPGIDVDSSESKLTDNVPRCVKDTEEGALFEFTKTEGNHYDITGCERDMSGILTWPILSDWMTALTDAITTIIDGSCGAYEESIWVDGETDTYIEPGCFPDFEDLQWTLQQNDESVMDDAGCMGDSGSLPWEETTCGGGYCDNGNLLVYKATLDQLNTIVSDLDGQLEPHSEECDNTCASTCPPGAPKLTWVEGWVSTITQCICAGEVSDTKEFTNPLHVATKMTITGSVDDVLTFNGSPIGTDGNFCYDCYSNEDSSSELTNCPCGFSSYEVSLEADETFTMGFLDVVPGGTSVDIEMCFVPA